MEGALDEIEAIGSRSGEMTGVPTGFTDLDALTNGMHPGQMIVIAARPAMGKSTLALDFARAASIKNNLPSVIFSSKWGATRSRCVCCRRKRGWPCTTCGPAR